MFLAMCHHCMIPGTDSLALIGSTRSGGYSVDVMELLCRFEMLIGIVKVL